MRPVRLTTIPSSSCNGKLTTEYTESTEDGKSRIDLLIMKISDAGCFGCLTCIKSGIPR